MGQIFLQQEMTKDFFHRQVSLDVCVADSQGRIGYILQNVFDNICSEHGIRKRAFSIITQVVVNPDDPAFDNPTKPIGVFYSKEEAETLKQERGWSMIEDAGRGYRRVVPSPAPLEIIEKNIFHDILELGFVAIGAGGGGIPVTRDKQGVLQGVEAVIDKDKTSALLAREVEADYFVMLTEADFVYLNFNKPGQQKINQATASEMKSYLEEGHFLEGSMKPKVEAAIDFVQNGGKKSIIANLHNLLPAIKGQTGTQILPD